MFKQKSDQFNQKSAADQNLTMTDDYEERLRMLISQITLIEIELSVGFA